MPDAFATPDYIPEDVQADHLDGARHQVASSIVPDARAPVRAPVRPPTTDDPSPRERGRPDAKQVGLITTAAALATVGLLGLSALWTWLAVTSGDGIWIAFAVGGWAVTAAVPGVLVGLWWHRPDTTLRINPLGDAREPRRPHDGGVS